jgi:hypothetical protein
LELKRLGDPQIVAHHNHLHHIREEFWGPLVGGDVHQVFQAEELRKVYEVLFHQAHLSSDGAVSPLTFSSFYQLEVG